MPSYVFKHIVNDFFELFIACSLNTSLNKNEKFFWTNTLAQLSLQLNCVDADLLSGDITQTD